MGLRPAAALWFELLVVRDDLTSALEILARSGRVELQAHSETSARTILPDARPLLEEFAGYQRRYGSYWPPPEPDAKRQRREPRSMWQTAMRHVLEWIVESGPTVTALQACERQQSDLRLLTSLFKGSEAALPDLRLVREAGPMLRSSLYLLAGKEWPASTPPSVLLQRVVAGDQHFLLAAGTVAEMASFDRQLLAEKARVIELPEWLPGEAGEVRAAIDRRMQDLAKEGSKLRAGLDASWQRHELAGALADINLVNWYVEQVPELPGTDNFSWITGWTSAERGEVLTGLLAEHQIRGLLRTSEAPPGVEPPSLFRNPPWMRPFESFTGLLGVPAAGEADPTAVVAIIGPLMFGYMFGDVAHGAVLMLAGALFCRRFPALKLLIAGGAASIVFGFLYGSVFALENLIPALWLHPLEHPVQILSIPLFGGAALLLLGMLLDAAQQAWQHRFSSWLKTGAALIVCYLALLGAFFEIRLLWVALGAALWYVTGRAVSTPDHHLLAMGGALSELGETLLQLAVNTVSFVRVGAFALAHAGLSAAVVGVSEAPDSVIGMLLILTLGNVLIIGLEGLIVGIQTTRLLLFEFFIRFLSAGGRPFKPLSIPNSSSTLHKR